MKLLRKLLYLYHRSVTSPIVQSYRVVDENGNYIVDENGNYLVYR